MTVNPTGNQTSTQEWTYRKQAASSFREAVSAALGASRTSAPARTTRTYEPSGARPKDPFGNEITDAMYLEKIRMFEGVEVSGEKNINWNATGARQLTRDEIAMLKKTYDVTDLSSQDYYDLICDLTQLNAISAKEAIFKYYGKSETPFTGWNTCVSMYGDFVVHSGYRHQPNANLIETLLNGREYLSGAMSYVKTSAFYYDNQMLFSGRPDLFPKFSESFQESYDANERLLSVFSQLKKA